MQRPDANPAAAQPRLNAAQVHAAGDTHAASTTRTSRASLERLKLRHPLPAARARVQEIYDYLAAHGTQDRLDPFRIAERALGRAGNVGRSGLAFDAAVVYWAAANELSPDIVATVGDRRAHFLRALVEIQRGNNQNILQRLAGIIEPDNGVCNQGAINKFAECFVGSHPDVQVITNINERALDLFQGFVADVIRNLGHPYASYARLVQDVGVVTPLVRASLKAKIFTCLEGRFSNNNINGLVGRDEENYINNILSPDGVDYMVFPNEDTVNRLIADANAQLQMQLRDPNKHRIFLASLAEAEREATAEIELARARANLGNAEGAVQALEQQIAAERVVTAQQRAELEQLRREAERQRAALAVAQRNAQPRQQPGRFLMPAINYVRNIDYRRYVLNPLAVGLNYGTRLVNAAFDMGQNACMNVAQHLRDAEQRRLNNLQRAAEIAALAPAPAQQQAAPQVLAPAAAAFAPAPLRFFRQAAAQLVQIMPPAPTIAQPVLPAEPEARKKGFARF